MRTTGITGIGLGVILGAVLPLAAALWPGAAAACGTAASDCRIGERTYRIHMPIDGPAHPGAIVYAHGYRGSAAAAMRNTALLALADRLGVAFVAAKSFSDDWRIPGVPADPATDGTEELAYFDALVEALGTRHGIDTDRLMVAGFSAGGMMVWTLACDRPDLFAAFAPIAGTFWRPVPDSCGPDRPSLIHTHGTADRIVPLTGRPIGPSHQGDVFRALAMHVRDGGFGEARTEAEGDLTCAVRRSGAGGLLEFCTHPGGHSFRTDYLERAWRRFTAEGIIPPGPS